jgi:hypothetical protein
MSKYCPENERVKRDYTFYLEAANGKQNATIDAALRAIERFETSTNYKPFRNFHIEQARSFRARLAEETKAKNGAAQRRDRHINAQAPAILLPLALARTWFSLGPQPQRRQLFHALRTRRARRYGSARKAGRNARRNQARSRAHAD